MALSTLTISPETVRRCFPKRAADSHKGTYGHVLSLCGCYGMVGAAMLAGEAALRCGAGLLTAALPRSVYPMLTARLPEAVCLPLPETARGRVSREALPLLRTVLAKSTAFLCGCGLGVESETEELLLQLLPETKIPVILDADGINLFSRHIDTLKTVSALCLTPHPGEAARLLRCPVADIQADRIGAAQQLARQTGAVVVLKGHRTLIAAPEEALLCNPTGTPGMATGGSGDVLAGMIASFAAQGMDLRDAAMCGVYLHGRAGELAAAQWSQHAMLPSDMLRCFGELFSVFE